jgi:hypothetical protein
MTKIKGPDACESMSGRSVGRFQELVDDRNEFLRVDGLLEVEVCEGFCGLESLGNVARNDHHGDTGVQFGGLDDSPTIGIPEAPIGHDGVILVRFELFDGIVSGGRGGNSVPCCFQNRALQPDYVRFVIDAEDPCHKFKLTQSSHSPQNVGTNIALRESRLSIDMPFFPTTTWMRAAR